MKRKYFEVEDDPALDGRWYLNGVRDSAGQELDSREFTYGTPLSSSPLRMSLVAKESIVSVTQPLIMGVRRPGRKLDFTFADFDVPVLRRDIANLLAEVAPHDIQQFPVVVVGSQLQYDIINIIRCVPCIDVKQSEIEWWTEDDGRPDKVGKPRMISNLVVDGREIADCNIVRPRDWEIAIVVSDVVKAAFERAKVTGITFRAV